MDMALQSVPVADLAKERADRTRVLRRFRLGDSTFRIMTQCSAIAVLVLLAGVILSLVIGSLPAWKAFGFGFFTSESWNPVTEKFGAAPAIYGIWGLFVFAPWFQVHVQPLFIDGFANIPVLNQLFAGPPYGIGMLTAGLILAIMVLPFITSITREVFETVPPVLKEAAYGVGCTRWEVMRRVVIPYTRVGIIGGVMLGLGRALGETMAVTFVIGNAHRIVPSILAPGTTISASIANEFTEATGDLYTASLIALGLILFFITFIVLACARLMLMRIAMKAGG